MTFIRLIYSVIALACVVCLWAIFVFPRPSKQLSQRVSITSAYEDLGFVEIPPYYHNPHAGAHYLKVDID